MGERVLGEAALLRSRLTLGPLNHKPARVIPHHLDQSLVAGRTRGEGINISTIELPRVETCEASRLSSTLQNSKGRLCNLKSYTSLISLEAAGHHILTNSVIENRKRKDIPRTSIAVYCRIQRTINHRIMEHTSRGKFQKGRSDCQQHQKYYSVSYRDASEQWSA